nr:uncharacterized protein LOC109757717 [Aegilops tauschii subsp. strangulata]
MTESAGSQRRKGKETAEDLLARLTLQEEEEDDFVWEEELPDSLEPAKWLAIARVHTPKSFSPNALYGDMRAAWNPARPVVWRKIKENLFTEQFGCLGDWNKAMLEGPWLFRDQAVIMEEYDGFKNPVSFKLDKLAVWAQIHRLPNNFLIEPAVRGLASRIGEVEEVQLKLLAGYFGEFVRVKIKIDINAKIKHFVTGKKGDERIKYQVKYEKLPIFCYNCGEFGHWHEECGDGEHDEMSFEWGDFLFADNVRFRPFGRGNPAPQRGRGGPGMGDRGRGCEQYNPDRSWRFNAQEQQNPRKEGGGSSENTEKEKGVTADSTPQGMMSMGHEQIQNSNKRTSVDNMASSSISNSVGRAQDDTLALILKQPQVPPLPPVYVSPRKDQKRPKKGMDESGKTVETGKATNTNEAQSAGSFEEHRRAQ